MCLIVSSSDSLILSEVCLASKTENTQHPLTKAQCLLKGYWSKWLGLAFASVHCQHFQGWPVPLQSLWTPQSLPYFNVLYLQLCSLRDFYFSGRKHGKWQQPDFLVIAELWVKYFAFHCWSYNGCEIFKTNFKCIIVAQYFPVCKRFSFGVWLFGGLCAAWVMNRPLGLTFIPACYPSLGCLQILSKCNEGLDVVSECMMSLIHLLLHSGKQLLNFSWVLYS